MKERDGRGRDGLGRRKEEMEEMIIFLREEGEVQDFLDSYLLYCVVSPGTAS